jgi:hypothetical protein
MGSNFLGQSLALFSGDRLHPFLGKPPLHVLFPTWDVRIAREVTMKMKSLRLCALSEVCLEAHDEARGVWTVVHNLSIPF